MVVQANGLAPTAAWEAERLSTYRTGSIVNVIITQQKNRKLERKYWAILNRVVRDCPTPWREAEDAHRALRLTLGVVTPFVTTGGKMHAEVKSTADMDDPEYQRYYEDAMALLHRIIGVDPETLHLESADVGDDQETTEPASDAPSDDAASSGSVDPHPDAPAASLSDPAGPEESTGQEGADPASPVGSALSDDDKTFLVRVFKTMRAAVGPEVDVLKAQSLMFKDDMAGRSLLVKAKATKIRTELERCCGDNPQVGTNQVAAYLAGIIGVEEKELRS